MTDYSRAEVARILSDCEILLLNDGETQALTSVSSITRKEAFQPVNDYEAPKSEEEDFERAFYACKLKKQVIEVSLTV